jgi:Ca-activated chloride channel homolog
VLILALARPWVRSTEPIGQNAIIVLDTSASMAATDAEERGGKTRFDAAKERAVSIIDNLPQDGTGTIIASADHASVVVPATGDRARLRNAINGLDLEVAATDMVEAMKLARVMASRQSNSAVWVLSDGAFPVVREQVEPVPAPLNFVAFGREGANQAITALSLQHRSGSTQLFVQVFNTSTVTATRRLDLSVDDAPWTARSLSLAPGTTQELVIEDVPLSARVLKAELAGGIDSLPLDDRSWVVNRASAPGNVLLVTEGNKFLRVALSLLPNVTLYEVDPKGYAPSETISGTTVDLTVIDAGVGADVLGNLPAGNVLLFAPTQTTTLITVRGTITDPVPQGVAPLDAGQLGEGDSGARDPLLKYVDLSSASIAQASLLELPRWGRPVLVSDKGPLIIAGEEGSRKAAVVAFDPRDSDLPLQTAFPLLLRNLVSYLLPDPTGGLPANVAPGSPVGIAAVNPTVDKILVEDPQAREWTYSLEQGAERVAFPETSRPGVYYVSQYSGADLVAQEAFAVNLFSRDEAAIAPNLTPALPAAQAATTAGNPSGSLGEPTYRRELWPWVAAFGFLVLLAEWMYAQRMAVRRALTEWQTRRALSHVDRT